MTFWIFTGVRPHPSHPPSVRAWINLQLLISRRSYSMKVTVSHIKHYSVPFIDKLPLMSVVVDYIGMNIVNIIFYSIFQINSMWSFIIIIVSRKLWRKKRSAIYICFFKAIEKRVMMTFWIIKSLYSLKYFFRTDHLITFLIAQYQYDPITHNWAENESVGQVPLVKSII